MGIYLVTGAAGFIGSRVCAQLLAAGHSVVGVDNMNDYYDARLKAYRVQCLIGSSATDSASCINLAPIISGWSGRFMFHNMDIEDAVAVNELFSSNKFDAVYNLAARAGVRYSLENPYVYLSTNATGSLNLLDAQRKFGVKKFILASTSSLYAGGVAPFREDAPVNEPLSPYAASKKAAEAMAYAYHRQYGIDVTILRYFTVFGPAGRPDMSPFRFIKWISEGSPVEIYGDGTQSRDFTFVDDVARGTILAEQLCGYNVVNLGGGRSPLTINAIISLIESMVGRKANAVHKAFHSADMTETSADVSKAKRLLGWEPQTGVEEGFMMTAKWYNDSPDWIKTMKV